MGIQWRFYGEYDVIFNFCSMSSGRQGRSISFRQSRKPSLPKPGLNPPWIRNCHPNFWWCSSPQLSFGTVAHDQNWVWLHQASDWFLPEALPDFGSLTIVRVHTVHSISQPHFWGLPRGSGALQRRLIRHCHSRSAACQRPQLSTKLQIRRVWTFGIWCTLSFGNLNRENQRGV